MQEVCETLNYSDSEALYAAIGEQNVNPKSVAGRFLEILKNKGHHKEFSSITKPPRQKVGQAKRKRDNEVGVVVEGVDDVMIRLAKCCTPVPPDEIMGFVTRGRESPSTEVIVPMAWL